MRALLLAGVALTACLIGPAAIADATPERAALDRIDWIGGAMDLKLA